MFVWVCACVQASTCVWRSVSGFFLSHSLHYSSFSSPFLRQDLYVSL